MRNSILHTVLVILLLIIPFSGCDEIKEAAKKGIPGAECSDGDLRCSGNILQMCENSEWADLENCGLAGKVCDVVDDVPQCVEAPADGDQEEDVQTDGDEDIFSEKDYEFEPDGDEDGDDEDGDIDQMTDRDDDGMETDGESVIGELIINEVSIGAQENRDSVCFTELYGTPGLSLEGFSLVGVSGTGAGEYSVIGLSGVVGPSGYFVIASDASVTQADLVNVDICWQVGPDSIELSDSSGVWDALGYGPFGSLVYFAGEGSPSQSLPAAGALGRCPDAVDSDNNSVDFLALSDPTPGAENDCDCIDFDRDGFGEGPGCYGRDCNDEIPECNVNCNVDTDTDGVIDCLDGCPEDTNKLEPGECGCGVPDTDSDNDGTPNCNDDCPLDGEKTEPGICGCGTSDVDTDTDGTPDCNDLCPEDINKVHPGACGCGESDEDIDGDGLPDCFDYCPSDPDKVHPGVCGCGVPDTDTDNDETPDCEDDCPNDINKIEDGVCGCGNPDTDTDNDGAADCIDQCAADPYKTAPGVCGCGVSDIDSDNDGAPNCIDGCPLDINKTAPEICGCGVADTDSDEDGTPDCNDDCPNDINKTEPGECGCGEADTDSDNDGAPDCNDRCPNDINKTEPGLCGCGVSDVDTDLDGLPDCFDLCPEDPNKTGPGFCGCGEPDTDTDNDGTPDCTDGCPEDPLKTSPGLCGCGVDDSACTGPCVGVICGPNAHCEDGDCFCDNGYEGNPILGCDPTDPCSGVTCGTNAYCFEGECHCQNGYDGDPMVACVAVVDCTNVVCGANAHCVGGSCICDDDYEGDPVTGCTVIDYCEGVDCATSYSANSHCEIDLAETNNYICVCDLGYNFEGGACQQWCIDDALEDNDTADTALEIELPYSASSIVSMRDGSAIDYDFYLFRLSEGDLVKIDAAFSNNDGDLDLYMWWSGNPDNWIASSQTADDDEQIIYQVTENGFYYLLVYPWSSVSCTPYSLSVELIDNPCLLDPPPCMGDHVECVYRDGEDPNYECVCEAGFVWNEDHTACVEWCPDDEYEPNDTYETASGVEPAFSQTGLVVATNQPDWYVFSVPESSLISVDASFIHDNGDVDIYLYSADNPQSYVDYSLSVTDGESISYYTESGGDFLLRVMVYQGYGSSDICTGYDLDISYTLVENPCLAEPPVCTGDHVECIFQPAEDPVYECLCEEGYVWNQDHTGCTDNPCEGVDCISEYSAKSHCETDWSEVSGYVCVCNNLYAWDEVAGACLFDCADDALEDNDFSADAIEFAVPYSNNSLVSMRDAERDYDWFAFDLNAGEAVRVLIEFLHAEGDVDLYMYGEQAENGSQNFIERSWSTTDNEQVVHLSEAGGRYWVAVQPYSMEICTHYALTVEFVPNPCDEEPDPCVAHNAECNFLPDQDPAYECVCDDGLVWDEIDEICVSDPCESVDCPGDFSPNSHCEIDWQLENDYRCVCDELYEWDEAAGECAWFCSDDALEEGAVNDSSDNATAIDELPYENVSLVAQGAEEPDLDWFAFNLDGGQGVSIFAEFANAEGDIDLKLFDYPAEYSAYDYVIAALSYTDNEEIAYIANASGTYYLAVAPFLYGGVMCNPYRLTIESIPNPCDDDPCNGPNEECVFTPAEEPYYSCECVEGAFPDPYHGNECTSPCSQSSCPGAHTECIAYDYDGFDCVCEYGYVELPESDPFECYNPCEGHPCSGPNELGCIPLSPPVEGRDWECGCEMGYIWDPVKESCEEFCSDGNENDDSSVEATPVTLPYTSDSLNALYQGSRDYDWFKFDLEEGQFLHILVEFIHQNGDVDARLFNYEATNEAYDPVASGYSTSDNEEMNYRVTTTGAYYLSVFAYYNDICNSYQVTIEVSEVCDPNPCEGANTDCVPTPSGSEPYKCVCSEGYIPVAGSEPLECYDPCEGHPCDGANENGCVVLNPPVGGHDWACDCTAGTFWDFTTETCISCADDDYEENDTSVAAIPFTIGDTLENLVMKREGATSDLDWFSFHLDAGEEVYLLLEFTDALGDIDVSLFDYQAANAATDPVAGAYSMSDNESFIYSAESSGDYYLRVKPWEEMCNSYGLTVKFTPCSSNPCGAVTNSSGACINGADLLNYSCVCEPGYVWDAADGACVPDPLVHCSVNEPPLAIPDYDSTGVDDVLNISSGDLIGGPVCLIVDISHTYRGDIEIELTSPSSGPILVRESGYDGTDDLYSGYELDDFAGENPAGEWTVNLEDTSSYDEGSLNSWCIRLGPCPEGLPTDL